MPPTTRSSAPSPIVLERLSARIHEDSCLREVDLQIEPQQHWAVLGPNGSGKSALGRLLCCQLEILTGHATLPDRSEYVSFERVRDVLSQERYNDDSNSRGGADPGTLVAEFILAGQDQRRPQLLQLAEQFQLTDLLGRGLKHLSTGEMRKTLICQALCSQPDLLVLDEPFDGLDRASRQVLGDLLDQLFEQGPQMVLLLNRFSELPEPITHIAYLEQCRLPLAGPRDEILASSPLQRLRYFSSELPDQLPHDETSAGQRIAPKDQPLIRMRQIRVSYRGQKVLNGLNWQVAQGEHWMIVGPNGSGKTTLLELISGDNPQAYANDIELFGRPKGSGESVWEIKQRIGHLSTAVQQNYRVGGSCLAAIISGFFDSIGVYHKPTPQQIGTARYWLKLLRLEERAHSPFQWLSFGEQRLVLLARAMVKRPQLLILDEPCQGLDELNRAMILKLINRIGSHWHTQLLYVTHNSADSLPCIKRQLELIPALDGGCRERITNL